MVADCGDRLWQDHRGDGGAFAESTFVDRGDRVWQDHRGDAGASPESTSADRGDGIGDGNTRDCCLKLHVSVIRDDVHAVNILGSVIQPSR